MNFRGRNKVNPQFNMSSMTDIVFLLLIFFMITSTLVTTSALDIILPKASGKTVNKKNTSVTIKKNRKFYLNNNKFSTPNSKIEAAIRASIRNFKKPVMVLRAEESVPISKVVRIMDIANRNKIKIILAVRPK